MATVLWVILAIVVIGWLLGLVFRIAGNAIHLLLIVALAILIYNLVTGRRSA